MLCFFDMPSEDYLYKKHNINDNVKDSFFIMTVLTRYIIVHNITCNY